MWQRAGAPAAVLAFVVIVAASCGGGGRAALSYPVFEQKASGICLRYHRGLDALGPPASLPGIARVARGAYRLGRRERRQLAQLDPPAEAADRFRQLRLGLAQADALLPKVWRAAEAGDARRVEALARRGRSVVARANAHAVALGLDDCRRA